MHHLCLTLGLACHIMTLTFQTEVVQSCCQIPKHINTKFVLMFLYSGSEDVEQTSEMSFLLCIIIPC